MINGKKIIISLTSFPAALPYAVQAIRSVLRGCLLPDKIVLYLDTWNFPDGEIPQAIKDLQNESSLLEVRFDSRDIRSYKKLIPALEDFPEDIIVTVDDDINYHRNMLKDLVMTYEKHPGSIIAHRVRKVKPDKPYSKWRKYKWYDFVFNRFHFSHLAMQTGVGGVLYPPHSLDETMLDPAIFTVLAPTTDDIWFWAAAVSKGTYVIPVPFGKTTAREVGKPQELSLKTINVNTSDDRNRKAFDNVIEHHPHIREKVVFHDGE